MPIELVMPSSHLNIIVTLALLLPFAICFSDFKVFGDYPFSSLDFLVSSPLQPPEIFSLTLTQQLIALVIPYTDLATANIPIPFPGSLFDYCLLSLSSLPFSDSKSDMSGSHPILEQVTFPSPTWTLGTRTHSEILLFVVNNC